jgi:hypothetical protein
MAMTPTRLSLAYLCGYVALGMAIAEPASAVTTAGSGCGDSLAYTAFVSGVSSGNAGNESPGATAESGPGKGCQEATGSCDGSPCSSITCTSTSSDGTATSESYTVNPPMSNPSCAGTFCQKKCQ